MNQKLSPTAAAEAKGVVAVTGNNRKLLIKRLREIDKLTAKELSAIMEDAEKIKAAFQLKY